MLTYFCPGCWRQLDQNSASCPYCKYDLAEFGRLSYEEKLLLSLDHPIRENRALAIQTLGTLRSEKALRHFEAILEGESDFYVIREVLHALARMNTPRSRAMLSRAARHPSRLVRRFARGLLQRAPAC